MHLVGTLGYEGCLVHVACVLGAGLQIWCACVEAFTRWLSEDEAYTKSQKIGCNPMDGKPCVEYGN